MKKEPLESAKKAQQFVRGMSYDEFLSDEKTQFAVKSVGNHRRSGKKDLKDLRRTYPEIPWREISGTRDKLIHDYTGVNLEVVWRTVVR